MSKIKVNDISLDYEDYGSGKVLLMLHGLGSTKKDWDALEVETINSFSACR